MSGCGVAVDSTPVVQVDGKAPDAQPPTIKRPVEGATAVTIENLVPGAWVDVFVNDAPRTSTFCAQSSATVSIIGGAGGPPEFPSLAVGDKVKARQALCGVRTSFGLEVVTVPPPPIAQFSASPASGRIPLTVHFTNQSAGKSITTWFWTFGGVSASSPLQVPPDLHLTVAGSWIVALTVTNAGGSSTFTMEIDAYPPEPVPCFTPHAQPQNLMVTFQDCSSGVVDQLFWTYGDGATAVGAKGDAQHQYATSGTYNVTQVASNKGGPSAPITHAVTVTAPPPQPVVIVSLFEEILTVQGAKFPPNTAITIVLFDESGLAESFFVSSGSFGSFNQPITQAGCTGSNNVHRFIKATADGGITWSNVAQFTC
jgi:PKD repeat protein